jgi:hypothetical protein
MNDDPPTEIMDERSSNVEPKSPVKAAVEDAAVTEIDLEQVDDWTEAPVITFEQQASLQIAKWILGIFACVYIMSFLFSFCIFWMKDATSDGAIELVKFLLSSILPLVTLAVGYYLGDRSNG